jgi:F0F1-type ATP synthase assembly protein I
MVSGPPHKTTGDGKGDRETQSVLREISPYLTLGFQLAAVVVIFFFAGEWVDRRFGIDPVGKLLGVLIGMIGGFMKFFKSVARLIAAEERDKTGEKREN